MPNILSSKLRHKNIDNFIKTVVDESVYFAFSNPESWTNEANPDLPKNSFSLASDVFSDMLYAKKVIITNTSRVIRNYSWVSGSRYQAWSNTEDISDLTRIRTYIRATATANLTAGVVTSITITNPGSEYTSAPTVTFSSGSAVATAVISAGSVIQINILNGGSGYTTPPTVTLSAPSTISNSTFELRPFYVLTDEFKVYKCLGNASGAPSTVKPTSTSTAAGITETTSDGYEWKYMFTVSTIDLERFYTSSWIPIKTLISDDGSDQWDIQTNALAGSAPFHGSDPVIELDATNLMLKVRVAGNEGGLIVDDNDYRQISIILNPIAAESFYTVGATGFNIANQIGLNPSHDVVTTSAPSFPSIGKKIIILSGKGKGQIREISARTGFVCTLSDEWEVIPDTDSEYGLLSTATVVNQTTILDLGIVTNGPFVKDTTVTQSVSGATGKVVKYDEISTPKQLYLTSTTGVFDGTNNITVGSVSSTVTAVKSGLFEPNIGEVIYLENRKPITRFTDQIEDVKVIIQY